MGTLYIIGTPIGNLEDITLRALSVCKKVDYILCEDTRVTKRLLSKYGIATPVLSYHAHSSPAQTSRILSLLEQGKNLGLVSDAGTPGISDPGTLLVSQIRNNVGGRAMITPIPGPSALTAALSASGISSAEFTFLGFLPHKKGRETLFREIAISRRATVFYESPHRVEKTLASLEKFCGNDRNITIARELTKIYEEYICGTTAEIRSFFSAHPEKLRGEFVVIVEKNRN